MEKMKSLWRDDKKDMSMGISEDLVSEFEQLLGSENVLRGEAERQSYAYDSTLKDMSRPALVLRPESAEQLGATIRLAYQAGVPMTVRGSGTSLCGGATPVAETGVIILTTGLNRILELNEQDGYAIVEPGVRTGDFVKEVEKKGLFYPPDPGSLAVCTLGGNIAENSGGARGLKYGTVKNYVLGLEFFDGQGNLILTGARTLKCATGYDLTPLVVGSEGTLGIIARAVLRLIPRPEASKTVCALFSDTMNACAAAAEILSLGIVPARMEFMDMIMLRSVQEVLNSESVHGSAALLIEVDGCTEQTEKDADRIIQCCQKKDVRQTYVAHNSEEASVLWQARADILRSVARDYPSFVLEDATVPRSAVPALLHAVQSLAKKFSLNVGMFGHLGDGNMHPVFLFDKADEAQCSRVHDIRKALAQTVISLKGTLSGEYGTGSVKACWLEKELPPATIALYKSIKHVMDPKHLLNPGKVIPE